MNHKVMALVFAWQQSEKHLTWLILFWGVLVATKQKSNKPMHQTSTFPTHSHLHRTIVSAKWWNHKALWRFPPRWGFLDPDGEEGYDLSKRNGQMGQMAEDASLWFFHWTGDGEIGTFHLIYFPIFFLLKINADFISKYSKDGSIKEGTVNTTRKH